MWGKNKFRKYHQSLDGYQYDTYSNFNHLHSQKSPITHQPSTQNKYPNQNTKFHKLAHPTQTRKYAGSNIRHSCEEFPLPSTNFLDGQYRSIQNLKKQMTTLNFRLLAERKKDICLRRLIQLLFENLNCPNHNQIKNHKIKDEIQESINKVVDRNNWLITEKKEALEQIEKYRKNRLYFSQKLSTLEKSIKNQELNYLDLLSQTHVQYHRYQTFTKQALDRQIQPAKIAQKKTSKTLYQQSSKQCKIDITKKSRNRLQASIKFILEQKDEVSERLEKTGSLETVRLRTFKNIWSKHKRVQYKSMNKEGNQQKEQFSDKLCCLLGDIPEFYELRIKLVASKLQMPVSELKIAYKSHQINPQLDDLAKKQQQNAQLETQISLINQQIDNLYLLSQATPPSCHTQNNIFDYFQEIQAVLGLKSEEKQESVIQSIIEKLLSHNNEPLPGNNDKSQMVSVCEYERLFREGNYQSKAQKWGKSADKRVHQKGGNRNQAKVSFLDRNMKQTNIKKQTLRNKKLEFVNFLSN